MTKSQLKEHLLRSFYITTASNRPRPFNFEKEREKEKLIEETFIKQIGDIVDELNLNYIELVDSPRFEINKKTLGISLVKAETKEFINKSQLIEFINSNKKHILYLFSILYFDNIYTMRYKISDEIHIKYLRKQKFKRINILCN